ncbi:MAG: ATP-dependent DNA helicase RecG [Polyangiales bacterium]
MIVLKGLGATAARILEDHGVRNVGDLLLTLPTQVLDLRAPLMGRAILDAIAETKGRMVAIAGVVKKTSIIPMRGRRAVRVTLESSAVTVDLWWFFFSPAARALSGEIVVAGAAHLDPARAQVARIIHPRIIPRARCGGIEPLYAIKAVPNARIVAALTVARTQAGVDLESLNPRPIEEPAGGTVFATLLAQIHAPVTLEEHATGRSALRARLAWGEACWLIVRRLAREKAIASAIAPRLKPNRKVLTALIDAFGFTMTETQLRAIDTIGTRLNAEAPSRTLLTGDVGTGKTAVILAAAAQAVASKCQVAILAPTTLLADQYIASSGPLSLATGARIARLAKARGRDRAQHERVLAAIAEGSLDVVVGTHALLQDDVRFARLGLVIVDEQHRLGVAQRLQLVGKGAGGAQAGSPHLLTVSATPIPRTLALALRGEISTVHLDERPAGRTTPRTHVIGSSHWGDVLARIGAHLVRDERVFVVCARIDDDDALEGPGATSKGAIARADELTRAFGDRVVLVHGALEDSEKMRAIQAFRSGDARIMVGTSILEVGIDVPEATLMVIDGAERFGLAQLHQLRGRVGRGERAGECVLVHKEVIGEVERGRLTALVAASDGLAVARADLALRGPGDLDGARQAGEEAGFRYLDPVGDEAIVAEAAATMREALSHDEALAAPAWAGLRRLFARFDEHLEHHAKGANGANGANGAKGVARGEAG